jgi:threonine dehydrogenase-like Zn-dependent dehydrogenase
MLTILSSIILTFCINLCEPQLLSNDDVIIKVKVAGLCRTDKYAAQGKLKINSPLTLGHEFSGIVVKKGSEVKILEIGDRVSCFPLIRDSAGKDLFMGVDYDGAFAEYVRVQAEQVFPIPDSLTFKQAAYLEPLAASLAPLNLTLDTSAVGGIWGKNRIAMLTHRVMECVGYRNINLIDSSSERHSNHFDFLIETELSDEAVEKMIDALKTQGKLILKSRPAGNISFPVRQIVQKEIQLLGAHYGDFKTAISLLADKKMYVDDLFGDSFPLSQAAEILADTASQESKKIFFTMEN